MTDQGRGPEDKLAKKIESLLHEKKSETYADIRNRLMELRIAVHDFIGHSFSKAFNDELSSKPKSSLSDKRELVHWANTEMRSLGVAIQCPKTGKPAVFHADPGNDREVGRFQVELVGMQSGNKRTFSSPELFEATLIPFPDRREPLAENWRELAMSRKKSPRSRA